MRARSGTVMAWPPFNPVPTAARDGVAPPFYARLDSAAAWQGDEVDVLTMSLVRSNSSGEIGFLDDRRLFNVALTRARRGLIIFADLRTFKYGRNAGFPQFLDWCHDAGVVCRLEYPPIGMMTEHLAVPVPSARDVTAADVPPDRPRWRLGRDAVVVSPAGPSKKEKERKSSFQAVLRRWPYPHVDILAVCRAIAGELAKLLGNPLFLPLVTFVTGLHPHWYQTHNAPQDSLTVDLKIVSMQGMTRCPELGVDPTNVILATAVQILLTYLGLVPPIPLDLRTSVEHLISGSTVKNLSFPKPKHLKSSKESECLFPVSLPRLRGDWLTADTLSCNLHGQAPPSNFASLLLQPPAALPSDGIVTAPTNRDRVAAPLANWVRRHLDTALLPTRSPSALGDLFEALCGGAAPWEPRYFALRAKIFEGHDASSVNISDLVNGLANVLRGVRQLVLYSPGPDAVQSREEAEALTHRGLVWGSPYRAFCGLLPSPRSCQPDALSLARLRSLQPVLLPRAHQLAMHTGPGSGRDPGRR